MAKKEGYEKGVGPYSKNDVKLVREDKNSIKAVEIGKKVDPSWERNSGYNARLDKGKDE